MMDNPAELNTSVLTERVFAMPSSAARFGRFNDSAHDSHAVEVVSAAFDGDFQHVSISRTHMTNMTGTIKRLVSDKGFGFVAATDGNEYFFHQSAVVDAQFDQLREGQAVTFNTGQGPKGPRAENVRLA